MIGTNIHKILEEIPSSVKLVAVSKTKPAEAILEAYNAGQRAFGENKVQEMAGKYEQLPKDIEWHLIGHLQSNKVKYIAPFVHLIHAVDSLKLLETINKEAAKNNRVINCLLQFHIAQEETKFGLSIEEAMELITSNSFKTMQNTCIVGVMGMASFTDDEEQIRKEFRLLKMYYEELKFEIRNSKFEISNVEYRMLNDEQVHPPISNLQPPASNLQPPTSNLQPPTSNLQPPTSSLQPPTSSLQPPTSNFQTLSFGMSGDYKIAIEEGSNMIRVGSSIFGGR